MVMINKANVLRSICKQSFFDFFKEFWSVVVEEDLSLNWHIELLCNELQMVAERVFKGYAKDYDLVINVPPGSSKSTICSQMLNAWVWTNMPHARFICGSYARELAFKDSTKTRDIVVSEQYAECYPEIRLREDTSAKGYFMNTRRGDRLSVGVLGGVTGFHGHFLLVDDPLNPEESYSEASLKQVNRWMKETLPSRKVDKKNSPIIIIQQRLHENDPSGVYLEKKKVRHICLPGELAEGVVVSPPEAEKFYVDGLLDPVRMPKSVLEEALEDLGAYGYAAQFHQSPVPLGGGLFKINKLNVVPDPPRRIVRKFRSWDKAGTADDGAWSVGVLMGVDEHGRFWVLDVVRGQWDAWKREEKMQETAQLDGEGVPILIEVEGGSGGKESGQNSVINLAGYNVILYHPTGDKVARATPFASQVGAGTVYVLDRTWTKAYKEELKYFPHGKFKDQVDASSGAFNRLRRGKRRVGGMKSYP